MVAGPERADTYKIGRLPPIIENRTVSFFVEDFGEHAEAGDAASRFFNRYIQPFFAGISPRSAGSDLCYYTTTPDSDFMVDSHPDSDRLLVLPAWSGHGLKHSLAVGELAAQMLLAEGTLFDTSAFSIGRFDA